MPANETHPTKAAKAAVDAKPPKAQAGAAARRSPAVATPPAKSASKQQKTPARKASAKTVPAKSAQDTVPPKTKLVRDSFTMPKADFDLVDVLKERALGFKRPAKKSELLRAGLHVLSGLNDGALKSALDALTPLKPGRPKKSD